jgi:hypothetical protein
MKFARWGTLAAASVFTFICASSLKADEIDVQFSGVITNTDGTPPGIFVGEAFTGAFSYSTTDPFDVSIGGQSTYSLTSPEDSESLSVGSFGLSLQPLTGVDAFVSPGTSSYFLTQDFETPGISIAFYGDSDFLSSQALPDPFNTAGFTGGVIGFNFSEDNVDYLVEGNITQVSNVPESGGLSSICFAALPVGFFLFRRRFV